MKKLILLMIAGSVAFAASAQYQQQNIIFTGEQGINFPKPQIGVTSPAVENSIRERLHPQHTNVAAKTTNGGSRWYSHYQGIDTFYSNAMDTKNYVWTMWYDSSATERFSNGVFPANWSAFADVFDPSHFDIWNTNTYNDPASLWVSTTDAYIVDSVYVVGAYVKNANRPTTVTDSLIFSVELNNNMVPHTASQTNYSWVTNYLSVLTPPQTTMYLPEVKFTDANLTQGPTTTSMNAAFSSATGANELRWGQALTDADRTLPTGTPPNETYSVGVYAFAVPNGGLSIPAGGAFVFTYSFRSGDTYPLSAPYDSVNGHHRFMPVSGTTSTGRMPYDYYDLHDQNMSQVLFANHYKSTGFSPTITIEGYNTPPLGCNFHRTGFHVVCTTCLTVNDNTTPPGSVGKVNQNSISSNAYPNPAIDELNVPFNLNVASDVTVSLTNMLGQTVMSQKMNNVTNGIAVFNTGTLSSGIYFYTVLANGERSSGRVVIAH